MVVVNITLPDLSEGRVSHHSLHQVSDIALEAVWRLTIIQRARLECVFYWPLNVRMCIYHTAFTLVSLIRVLCAHLHQSSAVRTFINSCLFTKVFSTKVVKSVSEWHNQSAGGLNQEFFLNSLNRQMRVKTSSPFILLIMLYNTQDDLFTSTHTYIVLLYKFC